MSETNKFIFVLYVAAVRMTIKPSSCDNLEVEKKLQIIKNYSV